MRALAAHLCICLPAGLKSIAWPSIRRSAGTTVLKSRVSCSSTRASLAASRIAHLLDGGLVASRQRNLESLDRNPGIEVPAEDRLTSRPVLNHVFKVLIGRDCLSFFLLDASYEIAVSRTEARYCGDLAH